MVELVLRLFDTLAWPLRRAGVDYAQFRALLGVKLTLDGRRPFTAFQQRATNKPRNAFLFSLLMNLFFGVWVAPLLVKTTTPLLAMTLLHGLVMVMLALSLIADFSTVLLDTTDNRILQPRPISSRTVVAARLAHVFTYLVLLTLSLAAPSFLVGTIKYGLRFLLLLTLTQAATVCIVVGAVNVLYLLALRLTSGERLRDIILYFQVGMTILVAGGYQLLPRLMDLRSVNTFTLSGHWWVYFVPPAWLAAPFELLVGVVNTPLLVLTGLGVVVPLATILAALALAPGFKEALARLESAPGKAEVAGRSARGGAPGFAAWFTRQPAERAAFELLWTLSGRDRQFKLRTYPNVVLILILGAVFLLSDPEGLRHALETLPSSRKYLILLYMCCAMAPVGFIQMRFCDQYEAAWIYRVLPLATPGQVLRAGLKVAMVRLVLPSFALVALVALLIWHTAILPDLLLALCATVLTCTTQALLMGNRLPFSEPFGVIEGSGRVTRSLLYIVLAGALGWGHFALTLVPYGVLLAVPIVALAAWLTLWAYGRRTWEAVLADSGARSGPDRALPKPAR